MAKIDEKIHPPPLPPLPPIKEQKVTEIVEKEKIVKDVKKEAELLAAEIASIKK